MIHNFDAIISFINTNDDFVISIYYQMNSSIFMITINSLHIFPQLTIQLSSLKNKLYIPSNSHQVMMRESKYFLLHEGYSYLGYTLEESFYEEYHDDFQGIVVYHEWCYNGVLHRWNKPSFTMHRVLEDNSRVLHHERWYYYGMRIK